MLILTSPAKTLDLDTPYQKHVPPLTQPDFLEQAEQLVQKLIKMSQQELAELMDISDDLAELNYERFQNWHQEHSTDTSRPALFLYNGDIYRQLNPTAYNEKQQQYAQQSLRVISGLYGLLRPYDLIQPYRLEMKTKLPLAEAKSLADFWQPKFTENLNQEIAAGHEFLLNLASNEYAKAIDFDQLDAPAVKVDFKEKRDGKLKTIAIYAKQARGMMIEYCIKNQVGSVVELQDFTNDGYKFKEQTEEGNLLFVR